MKRATIHGELAAAMHGGPAGRLELFRAMLRVLERDQTATRTPDEQAELDFGDEETEGAGEDARPTAPAASSGHGVPIGSTAAVSQVATCARGKCLEDHFFESTIELVPIGEDGFIFQKDLTARYAQAGFQKSGPALGRALKKWVGSVMLARGSTPDVIEKALEEKKFVGRESRAGVKRRHFYRGIRWKE